MLLAQAASEVIVGPRRPSSIETWQEAMLPAIIGTNSAETRPGPRSLSTLDWSAIVVTPPPPVLTTVAIRSGSRRLRSSPASATASRAAATPSWLKRAIRRAALASIKSVGSNSGISAAICTFRSASTRSGTRRTPERPSRSESQKASTPIPIGVTGPMPVITIRWSGCAAGVTAALIRGSA